MTMLPKDFSRIPKITDTQGDLPQETAEDYTSLEGLVRTRFQRARLARQQEQELIWLASYRAWRGELSPDEAAAINSTKARMGAASSVYIKITKTKATAAYGQVCEILFANNEFPIGIEPEKRKEGLDKDVTVMPEGVQYGDEVQDIYGYNGDGRDIPKGATPNTLIANLKSGLKNLLSGKKLVEGPSPDSKQFPTIHPNEMAADNLEKVMKTQLEEGFGEKILRKAAYECVLYGTGVMKGPFSCNEVRPDWKLEDDSSITYNPCTVLTPKFSHVSVWNLYPDPDAETMNQAEFVIERHLLSRTHLRQLLHMPMFNKEAINELLKTNPHYQTEFWEQQIGKYRTSMPNNKYEVLEYWGSVDKEMVQAFGLTLPEEGLNTVQVNVWTCNGYILRVILNPFLPQHMPYHVVPYEEHPHRIWGIGVPENMADTQMLMNGHMRMSIDNLRLAGNLVIEVNEAQLVPGQDFTIFPGKVFRKQGGAPGQSVYGITFPNTSQSHLQMFDKVRQLADEATGLPSYAHGAQGGGGTTRTASGMSMLMSAAALNIKTVAANFDNLLTSVGQALFRWNMQFNTKDKDIRGNFKVVAKGTASLMQREVVTQRLLSLLQVGGKSPFLKQDEIIKELVRNMDLDGDKFVNDPETAKLYADVMGSLNQQAQGGQPDAGQNGAPGQGQPTTGGVNPSDQSGSGGGNIGFGGGPAQGNMQDNKVFPQNQGKTS